MLSRRFGGIRRNLVLILKCMMIMMRKMLMMTVKMLMMMTAAEKDLHLL